MRALAYREYYLPSNEPAAAWFGRYYAADAALPLYAGGEHYANAAVAMLEIERISDISGHIYTGAWAVLERMRNSPSVLGQLRDARVVVMARMRV